VKKKYTIIYNETVTHWFDVEAESEEEALDEFNFQVDNGEIDFSRGEVTDSSINIVEA
jgi:hypothetical protein